MRGAVAITLIIAGVVLIALPVVADSLYRADVVQLMRANPGNSVSLAGEMSGDYAAACYIAGVAIIAVGAFAGLFSRSGEHRSL